jgi:hypothetical protein
MKLYKLLVFLLIVLKGLIINQEALFAGTDSDPVDDYLLALSRFEPWAESVWVDFPQIPGSGYFGNGHDIRGNCSITLSYAALIRAFPKDPRNRHRISRVASALRFSADTHMSGPAGIVTMEGTKWGVTAASSLEDHNGWQSPLLSAFMGFTAALLEDKLDQDLIKDCKRVVAAEADYRADIPPASRYKRNTASEETGWQSNILALAAAWMPDDPRADKWLYAAKLYMANTYTVPKDSTGPMKGWIKTQTLFPSFGVENHGFFHPSYQYAGAQSLGDSYAMAYMLNPGVAKELEPFAEHNVIPVWNFQKGYVLETGELSFPSGLDWSLHQFEHVNAIAFLASHFKNPEAQWVERRLSKEILYRQEINGDGRLVGDGCPQCFYVEAVQVQCITMAYFHDEIAGFPKAEGASLKNHISHYPDVGLIIHRSDKALTTVSYGARTMSLVYPLNAENARQKFIISPNTLSLIGTDGKATLRNYKSIPEGFMAEFDLSGIKAGRNSRMIVISKPEAVTYIEIPSDTLRLKLKEWYLSAIENHPLTGGEREVIWNGQAANIKERSGTTTGHIISGWINIDNWMGYLSIPSGNFSYTASSDYNRTGAAEDALVFLPEDTDNPRAVVVLPGTNADITATVYKSLNWKVTGEEFKISYKLPGRKRNRLNVPLL